MELKDVILSTLAEMEEDIPKEAINNIGNGFNVQEKKQIEKDVSTQTPLKEDTETSTEIIEKVGSNVDSESLYLSSIRERLLVLFEGFQAPNNKNIEAKVDMTLNFLEYVLATIDARLEKINKGNNI